MSPARFCLLAVGAALLGGFGAHVFFPPLPPVAGPRNQLAAIATASAPAARPAGDPFPPPAPISLSMPSTPLPKPGNAEKIAALRATLASQPEQNIPELKLATEADWHRAAEMVLGTPAEIRRALGVLRAAAERRFAHTVQPALRDYLTANGEKFPADPVQLLPFVPAQIELAMLQRYRVASTREIPLLQSGEWVITQSEVIDPEHHIVVAIGAAGVGSASLSTIAILPHIRTLMPVRKAYQDANGGIVPKHEQLRPYITTPEQQAALDAILKFDREEAARDARVRETSNTPL
jgi:hypothetical protein